MGCRPMHGSLQSNDGAHPETTSGLLAGTRVAGITGTDRLRAAIPVRDECRMEKKPAVASASIDNRICRFAAILYENSGSDGTRTRDLRRDRPEVSERGFGTANSRRHDVEPARGEANLEAWRGLPVFHNRRIGRRRKP